MTMTAAATFGALIFKLHPWIPQLRKICEMAAREAIQHIALYRLSRLCNCIVFLTNTTLRVYFLQATSLHLL